MTDEIKKTVFKAPQIPKNVPAISQGSVIHQEKPQNQTENVSRPAPVATPAQGTSEEKGKNFVKDLNLPPKIMETKVMAAIVASIMVFGMMMGCMMFGGEEKRVVQGLTDVVINPDIQKNLWRCGQIDPNRECVLYIMNAKTYDRLGSDFFQEAQNITGVPKYSIQMINVRYANVLIRPGYIAQIYIPARRYVGCSSFRI